jgi:hypothetical protein
MLNKTEPRQLTGCLISAVAFLVVLAAVTKLIAIQVGVKL